tara:strand:- start:474 stop:911 length:438 start_codon:yes stop_codon:yes gene_type:complete
MISGAKKKYLKFKRKANKKTSSYIGLSDDISISIINILNSKNITKSNFAKLINKEPSVVSRWLNGQHNFTIKTIVDIENTLGEKVLFPKVQVDKMKLKNEEIIIHPWITSKMNDTEVIELFNANDVTKVTNVFQKSNQFSLIPEC